MNAYATVILAALLAEYAVHLFADAANLRTLGEPVPEEFRETYDPAAYRRSQEYTRTKTYFGIFSSTLSLAALLVFWFAGGFPLLDAFVRRAGWGELPTGLLFIGALAVLRSALSLPLSVYSTFVIEERFGFNRTTAGTFIADIAKGALLALVIGGPLLALVLWIFMVGGSAAWLGCWAAVTALTLIIQFVAPTWIMPLFNTFAPIEEGALKDAILAYAEKVRFPLQGVYVMDGSKRSSKSNAFFTGFGRYKRIALFDTLIKKHSIGELVAVVAHEIGHYKKRHILKGMALSILHTGFMLFLLSIVLTRQGLFDAFFMGAMSVYAGFVLFGILFTPAEFFVSLGMNVLSRKHEFEADRFSAETTGAPGEMVRALRTLSVDNLSHLTPHPIYVFLHYSHPPVLARIRALRLIGAHPSTT
jgi:STE24 endopeptidase